MLAIRDLLDTDLGHGFVSTLANLAPTELTADEALKVYQERLGQGMLTVVALDGEEVVGTASLFLERKFIHRGGYVGHIEDVVVRRGYEGRGIGQALVTKLIERCQQANCYKVILDCTTELVAFYRRVGFHPQAIMMRRDLP